MILRVNPVAKDAHGHVELSSSLVINENFSHRFYFSVDSSDYRDSMKDDVAPHLLSQLMHAMRFGGDLFVEGAIDQTLYDNLQGWMWRWIVWRPDLFQWVNIVTERLILSTKNTNKNHDAILSYTGGINSNYSFAYLEDDLKIKVSSLIFLKNFSSGKFGMNHGNVNDQYVTKIRQNFGVNFFMVDSNAVDSARLFGLDLATVSHGIYLAAAMHLFREDHDFAIISSAHSPRIPVYPWGSNTALDYLLSSSDLALHHHDYAISRFQKVCRLSKVSRHLPMIMLCDRSNEGGAHCGNCSSCVISMLAYEVAAVPNWQVYFQTPGSIERVMNKLSRVRLNFHDYDFLEEIRHHALINEQFLLVSHMDRVIRQNRILRNRIIAYLRKKLYDLKLRYSF
jgi:hypothetical protein